MNRNYVTNKMWISFKKDVISLTSEIEEQGNPFEEEGEYLIALHNKDIMDTAVVQTVRTIIQVGQSQYDTFVQERLADRSKPISDTIKKNNLPLFNKSGKKPISKEKAQILTLKDDCTLFSRLYIACQSRDGNLEYFFKYEDQPWPPALAQSDQLRGGQKADLVKCLESLHSTEVNVQPPCDAIVIDGAVVVQMRANAGNNLHISGIF